VANAIILDGKRLAADLTARVAEEVATLKRAHNLIPGLAVVLVGDDPASAVYVRNKARQTVASGMRSFEHRLPDTTGEKELLARVGRLNADEAVHGILVQLPLPRQIDQQRVIEAIDPGKDVDGFHPVNAGRLASGGPALVPCTPLGIMHLIGLVRSDLSGLEAVVIGRSNIVGKPLSLLLLQRDATVTICHSKSRDLENIARSADILVAAVGRAKLVTGRMVKPGAVVIDVGVNRLTDGSLAGDVEFASASEVAGWITPVPGGVGPMTIAMLLENCLSAASAAH
jgi:methylenetetrahydrofolate dehydrogenase (NADP+) / methenyltetrahydrofolate cyclohydrolase